MNKIKYVLNRIKKMNYQKMFNTIKEISKETKKSKLFIFNDIIISLKKEDKYANKNNYFKRISRFF